ncbi:unnamed protein product [Clonostachys rhizophaga]|uniref:Nephrocystin 3-like N-terminal domain-containing protein n=1 Tax=Clonostachys rhizophaga TaxID=160324 RepID=A0A9N9VGW4_9HYPO|nr:unnamed protein product [Clonostachys rhizophaga]
MTTQHQETLNNNDSDAVIIGHEDISNYNPNQILPESPETLQKIRDWLKPTAYNAPGGEYEKHLKSHVQGTGTWLTSDESYAKWLGGSEEGLLWIQGIPGSGKSVIAANLIHTLSTSNPGAPVLLFFFRQIINANHKPQALLRDWLDQLLTYSPPLQKELKGYIDAGRSIESLSTESLWKDLRKAFSCLPGKVFCVADALDEMDGGNESFLQDLASLGSFQPEEVKVLVTSRPVPNVAIPLRKGAPLQVRLQENLVDVDISTFVQSALSVSNMPPSDQELIRNAVPGRANGLFLYAKLAMDAFLEPKTEIQQVIQKLPTDLNALYTELLAQHAQRSSVPSGVQQLILQAVTHATRPLRLLELAEMIRFSNPDNSSRDLKATKELIRTACGPLLEILADETISVIHHSFTEYLKGTTRSSKEPGYHILHPAPTHANLAFECLRYLESRDSVSYWIGCVGGIPPPVIPLFGLCSVADAAEKEARLRLQHPFLDYAAKNWHRHVRKSEKSGFDQYEINIQIQRLIGREMFKVSPIHIAAKLGLASYARDVVLLGDIDPNTPDRDGLTPMWLAASKGHPEMIRVLVAAGANPDQEIASSGLKPLHEAATHNHHLVVQALLEAGVDPLTPKTKDDSAFSCGSRTSTMGDTPLMYACHNGHVKSVEVFLSFLKNISTVHQALMWASEMGKSEVVARILRHPGVDSNAKVLGDTPLFRACAYPDLGTVQVLLDAGADPRLGCECRRDGFGWLDSNDSQNKPQTYNCLHRLCGLGANVPSNPRKPLESDLCEILRLLIETGIDIHERTPRGQTALHGAVRSAGMTRALIEAGADVNAVDSLGNTPLYNVKSSEVLQILVEHGHANIETINSKGQTPLHFMLSFFSHEPSGIESIIKFITYGPDCNIPDGNGNRPLHIVVQPTYPKAPLIQALLDGGADSSLKNARGVSPLLSICLSPESMPAINMLLDAGADINAADSNGETLLFGGLANFSFEKEDEGRCIKALIERGADIAVRDLAGRTILHATVGTHIFLQNDTESTHGCKKLDFLVSLGLDLQAVDSLGNTLLHELAERARATSSLDHGHSMVDCWRKLVANGLDVDQKNHAGRTALHILSATDANWLTTEPGRPAPIDFVISQTQEIDSPDEDGITPLHLAAAGSVSNTAKLLEAGADPALATHEGLTALHLACRARQSNTVGLLISSLQSELGQSVLDPSSSSTVGVNAKARGFDYITPLFYACRSGQPETVALLIEAGAEVNDHALKGCAGFEDENALWSRHSGPLKGTSLFGASPFTVRDTSTPTSIFSRVSRAVTSPRTVPYTNPVKLEDTARPADGSSRFTSDMGVGVTARLEEILDMLLSKSAGLLPFLQGFIDEAVRDQKAYTARCFSDALKRYRDGTELEDIVEIANSDDREAYKAETRLLEGAKSGESNQELFKNLIHQRQYQAVNELARKKADFLTISEETVDCNFSVLVKNGFSSLVKTVGDIETTSRLVGGQWHAFGDKTRPGLWSEGNNEIATAGPAFLVQAVSRQLPNMAIVQLLVESFRVDINEFEYQRQRVNNESIVVPASSALHQVAHGRTWWQTFQALPYLLKAGANIEIRNFKGETPLLSALEEISTRPGLFQTHVVRTLLEWGADVNAVDNVGNTCLSYANRDINLLKALMKRGATPSIRAVFAAMEQLKVDTLEAFLKAGFDPNTKRIDQPPQVLGSGLFGKRTEPQGSTEDLPIYYACLKLKDFSGPPDSDKHKKMTEIVQMLLKYGADPFAKFLVKAMTPYSNYGNENKTDPFHRGTASPSVPEGYEERTVLHELMRRGEPPNILLDIEGLEINRQDAQGRTLLQLACQNNPDQITTADQEGGDQLTRFQKLVSLGATLEARDNFGQNILHYLVDRDVYIETPKLTLGHILDKAPHLALQSDNAGHTPLHNAVRLAAFRRHTDTAETLLSAGADALAVRKSGDNMLHLLATNLDTPELRNIFHDLARRGVDINARNADGETPLFAFSKRPKKMLGGLFGGGSGGLFAPLREYSEDGALQLFQNLGADFSVRNGKGQGLLHVAASGDVGRFKELLSMRLDPMLEDDAHQTPIDVAAACGNQDILALFEKKN